MQKKTFWSEKAWDVNFGLWYHRLFKRIWSPLVNFIFMPARLSKQLGCDKRKSVKLFRKHVSDKQCLLFKMHHSLAMPPFSKLAIPKCLLQTIILASGKPGKMKTWYYMGLRCICTIEVTDWCSAEWKSEIWVDDIHWTCTNTLQLYWDLLSELTKAMLTAQRHTIYRERICFVVKQKADLQMIQGSRKELGHYLIPARWDQL